jgi:hypothetical protein
MSELQKDFIKLFEYFDIRFKEQNELLETIRNETKTIEKVLKSEIDSIRGDIETIRNENKLREEVLKSEIDAIRNENKSREIEMNKRMSKIIQGTSNHVSKELGKLRREISTISSKLETFEKNISYGYRVEVEVNKCIER